MPRISVVEAKTAISRTKLGFNYAINPYRGCAHGCIYCYAPYVLHETREWGSFVEARQNLPELLAREVRKVGKEEVVGIGTATDPYQPPEEEFCITKRCIQILKNTGRKCVIQTKSSLVLRDIDMLAGAEVGITITTTEPDIASAVEPRASSPEERLNALRELGRAGIKTFAFVGPVFPSIFRDPGEREKFFYEVAKAEPGIVMLDRFRVRVGMEEKIKRKAPEIYSKLFAEAFRYKYEDWDSLLSVLKEEVKKFGLRVGVAETEKW
ncbi:MAG: radical SAM protein [Thermoplasmata archaeon]|nr:radical SAM protein [Thermoplasmata archaeon]